MAADAAPAPTTPAATATPGADAPGAAADTQAAPPPPAPRSRQEKIRAALDAAKAKVAAANKPPPTPAAAEPPPPADGAAPAAEPAAAAPEATPPADPPEATPVEPPEEKPAKVWAEINRVKADVARERRELKREREAVQRDRAEFSKVQAAQAELNELMRTNPKEFVKRLGGGSLRTVLEAAVNEQVPTPEQAAASELQAKLDAALAKLDAREKAEEEARAETERKAAEEATLATHRGHMQRLDAALDGLIDGRSYPHSATQDRAYLVRDIYGRILRAWDDGRGTERTIPEVLAEVEGELARRAAARSSGRAPAVPPARAAGAVETAKPEKPLPPSLTGTAAASRASPPVELVGKERKRFFAQRLRRVGE